MAGNKAQPYDTSHNYGSIIKLFTQKYKMRHHALIYGCVRHFSVPVKSDVVSCGTFVYTYYICGGVFVSESISDVRERFSRVDVEHIPDFIKSIEGDSRKGVLNILRMAEKRYKAHIDELDRIASLSVYENECRRKGFNLIAGIDEVGRGPLAGPVVTAAVILKENCLIEGINDSKKLTAKKREELFDIIINEAVSYSFGIVTSDEIDSINILQATLKAMKQAIDGLGVKPDFVLADAVTIPDIDMPQQGIIKGDAKSLSIGAASIIAKVYRDRMMTEYSQIYPEYGFDENKGYGSKYHIEAIKKYGPCPIHRKSFLKNFV